MQFDKTILKNHSFLILPKGKVCISFIISSHGLVVKADSLRQKDCRFERRHRKLGECKQCCSYCIKKKRKVHQKIYKKHAIHFSIDDFAQVVRAWNLFEPDELMCLLYCFYQTDHFKFFPSDSFVVFKIIKLLSLCICFIINTFILEKVQPIQTYSFHTLKLFPFRQNRSIFQEI
jgi:hypothetical protein